jgi:photosystem II stability/assembly factor-like uncharacterized protein
MKNIVRLFYIANKKSLLLTILVLLPLSPTKIRSESLQLVHYYDDGVEADENNSSSVDKPILSFIAIDTLNLWACVGSYLIKSHDGGSTWQTSFRSSRFRFLSIFFVDSLNGIVKGVDYDVGLTLVTTDGGETWKRQDRINNVLGKLPEIWTLYSDDHANLWIISGVSMNDGVYRDNIWKMKSDRSGWELLYQDTISSMNDVFIMGNSHVWIAGGDGPFWYCSQTTKEEYDKSEARVLGKISFTHDGGNTWTEHRIDSIGALTDIFFINKQIGWCGGYGTQLYRTDNGGLTWHGITDSTERWEDLYFFDENHGLALLDANFSETIDGGQTWRLIKEFRDELNNVRLHVIDKQHIWLYADHGTIYKYTMDD